MRGRFTPGISSGSTPVKKNPFSLPDADPAAVENPIGALFDLAGHVSEKAPHVKRNFWYSILFVGLWLGFSIVMFFGTLFQGQPFGAMIFLFISFTGAVAFRMLYFDHKFFDYFSRRFHAIKMVREGNPFRYIPQGDTPVDRLLNHLREEHGLLQRLLTHFPESLSLSAILKGRSGTAYQFDAYIQVDPKSPYWKEIWKEAPPFAGDAARIWDARKTTARTGYSLYIKVFPGAPTLQEITALEQAVNDITSLTGIPPRVIALTEGGTGELPEDLYTHLTEKSTRAAAGKRQLVYTVQVVSGVEGSYDFVPNIASGELP